MIDVHNENYVLPLLIVEAFKSLHWQPKGERACVRRLVCGDQKQG